MNNDLISRSALLADFKERNIWGKDILEAIDNAPAIAINCKECDGYEAGYSAGLNDAERPKGEWICITEGNLGINTYKCSLCGHRITCTEGAMKQHKGCYCGAVMKGGAE